MLLKNLELGRYNPHCFFLPLSEKSAGESRTLREEGKRGKEGLLKRRQKGNRKRTEYDPTDNWTRGQERENEGRV